MQPPPNMSGEQQRLERLKGYAVLDTLPEREFDNITLLASQICQTPIALISLVDDRRQWFKSRQGLDAKETSREVSFCGHAIASEDAVFEVSDSRKDPRFHDNPIVTDAPKVIFYAGAVLTAQSGERLGTLCVIDHEPRELTPEQRSALQALAEQVMSLLEARNLNLELQKQKATGETLKEKLESDQRDLQAVFDVSTTGMALVREPDFIFEKVNVAFQALVGPREYLDRKWADVYEELPDSKLLQHMKSVYETGVRYFEKEMQIEIRTSSGKIETRYYDISYDRLQEVSGYYRLLIQTRDVTRNVRSRLELAASARSEAEARTHLSEMMKAMPVGIAILEGSEPRYKFTNAVHDAYYGGRNDLLGKAVFEAFPELETSGLREIFHDVLKLGVSRVFDDLRLSLPQPDGTFRDFNFRVAYQPLRNFDGEITGILVTVSDETSVIAARQQLVANNASLVETQRLLAAATDVAKVGFFDWDMQKDIFIVSDQFGADWGVSSGVTIGDLFELIHPDDRALTQTLINQAARDGEHYFAEYRVRRKTDGEMIWIEAQGRVTMDEQGRAHKFFGTSIDITKRKLLEIAASTNLREQTAILENLRRLQAQLSSALENGDTGTWSVDFATNEVLVSPELARIYGLEEITPHLGNAVSSLVFAEDQPLVNEGFRRAAQLGEDFSAEFRINRADGVMRWCAARGKVERDADGNPVRVSGIQTDITSQKSSQLEIVEARLDADRANSAKSAFLANMSHEIRSPLGAIMGFAELMENSDLTRVEALNFVSVIKRNSNHVLRIIDDILDLSKVEAGKMLIEQIEFSLPDILADFTSLMGLRARDKGISLELRLKTPIPECVVSDPTRLRQILTNVVGNAIKFTEKGRVQIAISYSNLQLEFAVSDTGVGLTQDQANRLFEAFNQADASTTRKFGGTGLGLVLTRRLCEALGGSFELERSIIGKGSVFVAKISINVAAKTKMVESTALEFATPEKPTSNTSERPLVGKLILVVDDSPDNQVLFKLLLKKAGAEVSVAKDGFEGIQEAVQGQFDLVLMDVQMPRMDGHEAVQSLRAKGYFKPVIALTAHAMIEERNRAEASGFTDFLSKPVDREQLINKILEWC